jgi:hypothetical protein
LLNTTTKLSERDDLLAFKNGVNIIAAQDLHSRKYDRWEKKLGYPSTFIKK